MEKVTVSAAALRHVLNALNGPGHHIRELQVTRGPLIGDRNPINILCDEYNAAVEAHNEAQEVDAGETASEGRTDPAKDYSPCPGCEVDQLRAKVADLEALVTAENQRKQQLEAEALALRESAIGLLEILRKWAPATETSEDRQTILHAMYLTGILTDPAETIEALNA